MNLQLIAGVASALWMGAAALAAHERRRAPHPEAEPPAPDGPLVSVIVPARDEERGTGRPWRRSARSTTPRRGDRGR